MRTAHVSPASPWIAAAAAAAVCNMIVMCVCCQIAHIGHDFVGNVMGTFASLTRTAAVRFQVQYVAGFSDDTHGYSYFLTRQPPVFDPDADSSSETESKLIQVFPIHRHAAM